MKNRTEKINTLTAQVTTLPPGVERDAADHKIRKLLYGPDRHTITDTLATIVVIIGYGIYWLMIGILALCALYGVTIGLALLGAALHIPGAYELAVTLNGGPFNGC